MEVGSIPGALAPRGGDEGAAVGAVPVKAVSTVAQCQLGELGEPTLLANLVGRSPVDGQQADHQAFISHRVHVVKLGGIAQVGRRRVQFVGAGPMVDVGFLPVSSTHKVGVLPITPEPAQPGLELKGANAVNPDLAEGIVEKSGVVAAGAGGGGPAPVNAVRRGIDLAPPEVVWPPEEGKHLESLLPVRGLLVQPDADPVPLISLPADQDSVGARVHVQAGSGPVNPIPAGGVGNAVEPAGVIPHLEQPVLGVVKHAVIEGTGHRPEPPVHLQGGLRLQYRVLRVQAGPVIRTLEGAAGDEEVVHEQLPPPVNGDDLGNLRQVGGRGRRAEILRGIAGRPGSGEPDAVVESLPVGALFGPRPA